MRFPHLLFSALLLLAAPAWIAAQPASRPQFGHETSDLRADPRVRYGELPNGMRYAVLANPEPKQRATLRLLVMAGSLNEEENQRGLAHFLEHMAFNGSTHYPPGTMVEFFQRMGMSFGGDTNAYTTFEHTVYMLDLPDTAPPTLEEGWRVFGDYAGGLLLPAPQIEKERGIILSERRSRDSVQYRQSVAEFDFLLGTTLVPKRMPIGVEEVISRAPRERLASFYDTWYRPERMAVIAVGDFDAAAVEQQIRKAFSGIASRRGPAPAPALGQVEHFEGVRARYHHESEAPTTQVSIQVVTPYSPERDTAARRLRLLPRELALSMLNRRLSILAKQEAAPFIRGAASANEAMDFFLNAGIELTCKPEQWKEALRTAEHELRRAFEFGFATEELQEATANLRNELEQSVRSASTRRSDALAGQLIHGFVQGEVFTTPEDDLALYRPALEKVTPQDCVQALKAVFAAPGRTALVLGNAVLGDAPEKEILAVYEASAAAALERTADLTAGAFAYTHFGEPGTVASRRAVEDLGIDLLSFANGVRLNVKRTDFEAGQIQLSIRIGAGQLIEPAAQPGLAFFTNATFVAGGLGKHSVDEIERLFAGKTVGLGFRVGSDALVFTGVTNQADLLAQLQLLAAYIVDPGYRAEALRTAQKRFLPMYQQLEHTPNGPLQLEVPRILSSGDPRFGVPRKEELFARTLDESRAWMSGQLTNGAIEIGIVGDLDVAKTIEAVAQTLGALPPRPPKPAYEERRRVRAPEPLSRTFTVSTEIPKGLVVVYWPTTDARDVQRARRLSVLADVVSDRLRVQVREKLGESYGPSAGSAPDDTYRDYGFLYTYITVDPAKAQPVEETVMTLADDLTRTGVTDDEFERAKKPLLTALRESARTNTYWLGSVLSMAQEQPERLEWARTREADVTAMTKEEVSEYARLYLASKRAYRFTVLPAPVEPPAKTTETAPNAQKAD